MILEILVGGLAALVALLGLGMAVYMAHELLDEENYDPFLWTLVVGEAFIGALMVVFALACWGLI